MECVVLRGSVDGSGFGYGSGFGFGYGYGSGYGSGDGSGYGYGFGSYWRAVMSSFVTDWTDTQTTRFHQLVADKTPIAFWRSNEDGQPSNGGKIITVAAPGVIHETKGPLMLCAAGTLHATMIPPKWQGARVWIVALHGAVVGDDEKFGCLKREIIGECKFNVEQALDRQLPKKK